jgi:predicted transcriptional regulator
MKTRRKTAPRPTDGELEILRILWERGASTVREVHEVLDARHATGYTTVLKLLQIMTEKGLVERETSERAHVYQARVPREDTEGQLVGDLLERAFAGSASRLVMRALSSRRPSAEELDRIRKLLDDLEGERR